MRVPIAISALLLGLALAWGWRDHRQLASLRDKHEELARQAATRGLAVDETNSGKVALSAKTPRADRVAAAKQAAVRFVAYAKEMQALGKGIYPPDEQTEDRIIREMDALEALDAEQWKIVIAEIMAVPGEGWDRRALLVYALERLTILDRPQDGLEILTGNPEIMAGMQRTNGLIEGLVSLAIRRWAVLDPSAAHDWFSQHGPSLSKEAGEVARYQLIRGTAEKDPRLALELIRELGESAQTFAPYIFPKSTIAERNGSLALLREWSSTLSDADERSATFGEGIKSLAFASSGARSTSFADAATWIDQAALTEAEIDIVSADLENNILYEDASQWVEWLGKHASPDRASKEASRIFGNWVRADPKAAGKWLETATESPAKEGAIGAYAGAIVTKDPESAVRWALTLPEGETRSDTLARIHERWPRDTEEQRQAARRFAQEHGFE